MNVTGAVIGARTAERDVRKLIGVELAGRNGGAAAPAVGGGNANVPEEKRLVPPAVQHVDGTHIERRREDVLTRAAKHQVGSPVIVEIPAREPLATEIEGLDTFRLVDATRPLIQKLPYRARDTARVSEGDRDATGVDEQLDVFFRTAPGDVGEPVAVEITRGDRRATAIAILCRVGDAGRILAEEAIAGGRQPCCRPEQDVEATGIGARANGFARTSPDQIGVAVAVDVAGCDRLAAGIGTFGPAVDGWVRLTPVLAASARQPSARAIEHDDGARRHGVRRVLARTAEREIAVAVAVEVACRQRRAAPVVVLLCAGHAR